MKTAPADDRDTSLAWAGEIDLARAEELRAAVSSLAVPEGGRVVLDLSRVVFMDSTGLNVVVELYRRVSAAGGRLVVRGAADQVRRLLALTGVERLIELEPEEGPPAR